VPVNFRPQDKSVLDAALQIAKAEGTNITSVFRAALTEFVGRNSLRTGSQKMDEFLDKSEMSNPVYNRILTPQQLEHWSESSLLNAAKLIRSRKDELNAELRKRGFFFRW